MGALACQGCNKPIYTTLLPFAKGTHMSLLRQEPLEIGGGAFELNLN